MENSDLVTNRLRKKNNRSLFVTDRGAVAVEFAFTLLFLFLFVTAYVSLTGIFLGHQRLGFASYAAARVCATHGKRAGELTARAIESRFTPYIENIDGVCTVRLDKTINIPFNFYNIFRPGSTFDLHRSTRFQSERSFLGFGDND